MNRSKKNLAIDDDLKFIPLNIKEPFSSKDSNWLPFINLNCQSTTNMTNNFIADFATPMLYENLNKGLVNIPDLEVIPLPNNVTNNTSNKNEPNLNMNNKNVTTPNQSSENYTLEYPSETISEELYSYNSNLPNCHTTQTRDNEFFQEPLHMNLLRNFDFILDEFDDLRGCCPNKIDKIFRDIEENHSFIIGTLKAYKIPYPIICLLIKKIIKFTLNYSED
ncbi:hypothetical protein JCM1393_02200 [Clostridium carnis]